MKKFAHKLTKSFTQKLTLMVVPHSTLPQVRLQISLSFFLFLGSLWVVFTFWAMLAVFGNIDYWKTKASYEILKLKVQFFASEVKKNRELVDQVREADAQLRQLLKMGSRQAIIEERSNSKGRGGPEAFERSILLKSLKKHLWEISESEIYEVSGSLQKEAKTRLESFKEISEQIAYERGFFRATPKGWPAAGRVTSKFGERLSPLHGQMQFHTGVDIANDKGTPVLATGDGIVSYAGWESGYGQLIVIAHGFDYTTHYAHNSAILVKEKEGVKRGQIIAYMGSSGSSTGSHSHYEVWYNGEIMNPWNYMMGKSQRPKRLAKK